MANHEREEEFERILALRNAEFACTLASFAKDADLKRMLTSLAEAYEAEVAGLTPSPDSSAVKES
jgi:hypothetical protein